MENKLYEQMNTFPSKEEITNVFETIVKRKPYKELRCTEKEGEVTLYEIEVILEGGGRIEYNYQKSKIEGDHSASIHDVIYDENEYPYGGRDVANFTNGTWVYPN